MDALDVYSLFWSCKGCESWHESVLEDTECLPKWTCVNIYLYKTFHLFLTNSLCLMLLQWKNQKVRSNMVWGPLCRKMLSLELNLRLLLIALVHHSFPHIPLKINLDFRIFRETGPRYPVVYHGLPALTNDCWLYISAYVELGWNWESISLCNIKNVRVCTKKSSLVLTKRRSFYCIFYASQTPHVPVVWLVSKSCVLQCSVAMESVSLCIRKLQETIDYHLYIWTAFCRHWWFCTWPMHWDRIHMLACIMQTSVSCVSDPIIQHPYSTLVHVYA